MTQPLFDLKKGGVWTSICAGASGCKKWWGGCGNVSQHNVWAFLGGYRRRAHQAPDLGHCRPRSFRSITLLGCRHVSRVLLKGEHVIGVDADLKIF